MAFSMSVREAVEVISMSLAIVSYIQKGLKRVAAWCTRSAYDGFPALSGQLS